MPATQHQVDQLRAELAAAVAATSDAYRQSSRLIRVLTVLGQPSSPAELVDETLSVLSQLYAADVTAMARASGGQLRLTSACGIPEGDPAYVEGWPLAGGAAEALSLGRVVARNGDALEEADLPPSMAGLAAASAVWVPVGEAGAGAELLVMYRISPGGFPGVDLPVLASVAARLGLAVADRRRGAAVESLATFGHRLTSRLDLPSLFEEAARLLPPLVDADAAGVVRVEGDHAYLKAATTTEGMPEADRPIQVSDLPGWHAVRAGEMFAGHLDHPRHGGSLLAIPIMRDDALVLVVYAHRGEHRPFRRDAVDSAAIFATYVGAAMSNAELYLALRSSENSLRLITDSISDLIAVVDCTGRFVYASPSHGRALGIAPERLLRREVTGLVHPDDRAIVAAALAGPPDAATVEYRLRTGDESWVWVESALRPVPEDGTLVLSSRVIDERRRLEDELRRRATHDPLTELANRALTAERLEAALSRGDDDGVGLLFCDLDKFKEVNDRLGHEAGDDLLIQVADRLRACVRPADLLARFGGDEFVILLDGIAGLDEVTEIGKRVVRALEAPFWLHGEWVDISVSVGGVLGARGVAQSSNLLRDADAAMYAAKNAGRGRVEVFDEDASKHSLGRLELRSDLSQALARNELTIHYQPIVELDGGQVVGFEALCRWTHPRRGPIPPDEFIPLAEETGAIVGIGEWVLGEACRRLVEWQRLRGNEHLRISVNLSPVQLAQPDAAARTLDVITAAGAVPSDVWLEITEHSSIRQDVTGFVTALRAAGVHFALDDFGMAYSNLSHLKRLPVEILKIDKSFVAGLPAKDTDRGIVRAVLAIADSLGLTVVAEGIESADQRAELLALNCRQGQGYLFSRPITPEAATALLRAGTLILA
ncbi:putative bifunctional diguanylate cyclase/phosphodiesterase [Catenuloplanes atrovinosus]|uniref:Diguanylate cyclase (GGDEF)-like protein/PAS domain S-box-containing protein n=1 Tax=Catenuloplanes atrovinosus TaxID=137266 RepID=A0AAE4CDC1_9ACTN|nr:EAL domain-containing protein [Catenuloplanes atrovinosus]MDR7278894.1 diguanylate cyclase (GGDEF)-like protein/PAS domain S-box-containing protein [Catenuloplanes atrovinosus]